MKILDPGHHYSPDNYAAREGYPQSIVLTQFTRFRKRIGLGYPGNEGDPYDGTTCQEQIRILIDRIEYVDKQIASLENLMNLQDLRAVLFRFERRAAARRDVHYRKQWETDWFALQDKEKTLVEKIPACKICGYILCTKHL